MSDAESASVTTHQADQTDEDETVRFRVSMPESVFKVLKELADESFGGVRSRAIRAAVLEKANETTEKRVLRKLDDLENDIQELKERTAGHNNTSTVASRQPEKAVGSPVTGHSQAADDFAQGPSDAEVGREIYHFLRNEHDEPYIHVQTLIAELSNYSKADIMAGVEALESRGQLSVTSDNELRYSVVPKTETVSADNQSQIDLDDEQSQLGDV